MGRRYYCDYCDKVFIDDVEARKKHLNSAHHIKLRKLHYDQFRDIREVLKEESTKVPCRRHLGNGFCQFESTCKYTHYTEEQLWEMQQQILFEEQKKMEGLTRIPKLPTAEEWAEKYNQQKYLERNDYTTSMWTHPQYFENRLDIPPSLKKFQSEHFTDSEYTEWGE